jgi:hypothetical protein
LHSARREGIARSSDSRFETNAAYLPWQSLNMRIACVLYCIVWVIAGAKGFAAPSDFCVAVIDLASMYL